MSHAVAVVRPEPIDLPGLPCPCCGVVAVIDDARALTVCRGCRAVVGPRSAWRDDDGRRSQLRLAWSEAPQPTCQRCGGIHKRVLVDLRVGLACAGCGTISVPVRRRPDLKMTTPTLLTLAAGRARRTMLTPDFWLAAVLVAALAMVGAVEFYGASGSSASSEAVREHAP